MKSFAAIATFSQIALADDPSTYDKDTCNKKADVCWDRNLNTCCNSITHNHGLHQQYCDGMCTHTPPPHPKVCTYQPTNDRVFTTHLEQPGSKIQYSTGGKPFQRMNSQWQHFTVQIGDRVTFRKDNMEQQQMTNECKPGTFMHLEWTATDTCNVRPFNYGNCDELARYFNKWDRGFYSMIGFHIKEITSKNWNGDTRRWSANEGCSNNNVVQPFPEGRFCVTYEWYWGAHVSFCGHQGGICGVGNQDVFEQVERYVQGAQATAPNADSGNFTAGKLGANGPEPAFGAQAPLTNNIKVQPGEILFHQEDGKVVIV